MKFFLSIILCTLIYSVSQAQNNSLDYYLNYAVNNSPLLKDLKNQAASTRIDSLRLRATLKLQVSGNSSGLYAPVINGYGYSGAITNIHTLNALLGVNKSLISKTYVNAQLAAIDLTRDSLIIAGKLSEQDLKKTVIGQYITAYGSYQQFKFNGEIVDLLSREDELFKKLTRSNVYRQSDYLTFLVTLKQQQLQLMQSRLQYKNDFATLNYVAGIGDTTMVNLQEPVVDRTIRADLNSSIFFGQFRLDSLRLINSRNLLNYSYQPKANIFADGGYNSDFSYEPYHNFGASAGFNLTIPIYDGGQRKLVYRKLKLQEETLANYKAYYNTQYHQQVAQLEQQINDNETLYAAINEQVKYAESLIKVDTQLMQTGDLKVSDLILAINSYLTVKNLYTQTIVSKLQLINQLNYWNK